MLRLKGGPFRGSPDEVSIRELCNRMHARGYEYATLTRSIHTDFNEINPDLGLGDDLKPHNSLYFSKLERDNEALNDYVPDWYNHLGFENHDASGALIKQQDSYRVGNIAFAKVVNMDNILHTGHPLLPAYAYTDTLHPGRRMWDNMRADGFKGFIAKKEDLANEWIWDVATLVVWDPTALKDVVLFKRGSKDFSYINDAISIPLNHSSFQTALLTAALMDLQARVYDQVHKQR